jgi:hypothetical protein
MKLEPRYLRVTVFSLFLAVIVAVPFRLAEGRLETLEQAQADQKLFAQEMEMQKESENPTANDPSTVRKLAALKLDHVQWINTDVQAVLANLTFRSKDADPDRAGFQFVVQLPADPKQTDKLGRALSNNVCIVIGGKTSIYDLLMDISEQTNLAFRVQKGGVIFRLWEPGDCISFNMLDE